MTSLPPALATWAEPLSLFPPDLALSLGPCVRRLAQAIGPLPRPVEEASDQPDGYDGLSRRGPYERLLVSEWLLAEEVPEEFLRRAAQREHAFLALSFRRPSGSRRSLALFDAGPELIGGPRIGQLAALVVLAARARRDGAAFGWGVLQDEERRVSEEVTPASILRLLYSRTARAASAGDAGGWAEVAGEPLSADDLWVIGTATSIPLGAKVAGRLELEDSLQPGRRELLATVRRRGAAPLSVELPLPPREDCVRLVRDPFSARKAAAPRASPSPANGIAFSQNGRRLLVRHRDGSVSAHPVPNSPRMSPGSPKTFALAKGETLVAAGWMRRAQVVLVQVGSGLALHSPQRRSEPLVHLLPGTFRFTPATAPSPLSPLLRLPGPALGGAPGEYVHAFVDAEGRLFELGGDRAERWVRLVQEDVLACAERDGLLHVLRGHRGGREYAILHDLGGKVVWGTEAMPGQRALFGCDSPWIAIEREAGQWAIILESGRWYTLAAPSGCEVFGVAASPKNRSEPALLLVEADRRSTSLVSRQEHLAFPRTRSPILFATANVRGPELATLEADGTVTVVSLRHKQKVLELKPPSGAPLVSP